VSDDAGGHGDLWPGPAPDHGAAAPAPGPAGARTTTPPASSAPGRSTPVQIERTRISAVWVALIIAAALLVALVIFIAQNARDVSIHYVGLDGRVPLAVGLLVAAVAGMLLVAVPGTARIIQLRRAVKKSPAQASAPPAFKGPPAQAGGPPAS
jgi:lipopolysaccharide assembly protein A